MDTDVIRSPAALAAFGGLTAGVALAGGRASSRAVRTWYRRLRKPPFQPPSGVFGPVWGLLYTSSAIAGWQVWRTPPSAERTSALRWWGAQLLLNGAWSELFFGRRQTRAALADCLALAGSVAMFRRSARRVSPAAAALTTPYLLWTCFASLLNEEIVRRNPRFA